MKYLFTFCCCCSLLTGYGQLTYDNLVVDYDSAVTYKNLKIIPVRPKGGGNGAPGTFMPEIISLSEAIGRGLVVVSERGTASTENVHWLRIHNNSNRPVLISSGEIIAGGRQDRMITRDTIMVPNNKDQYVPVMCVEEGRWSDKEKKFAYSGFANARLRKILDSTHNQVLIWKEIDNQLEAGAVKNTSLAYLARNLDKKHIIETDDYFRLFRDKFSRSDTTVLGIVCISGDKVIGTDIFAGINLFRDQLEPLLRGYIEQAVDYGAPPVLQDSELRKYLDKELKDEKTQEEFVGRNGKFFRQAGRVIHINTF